MEPSLPSPPRTIIVIDHSPSEVSSFLCSMLDAHALPYAVQVIVPGAPVWSKYSNSPSHVRLRLDHHPSFGLSSAPLSPILRVNTDGTG